MKNKKEKFTVKWGTGHKKVFTNPHKALNFAYDKSFYFDVWVKGGLFRRIF